MMPKKVKALMYICACTRVELYEDTDPEEPLGFHGTVRKIGPFGSSGNVDWWACHSDHIVASINRALAIDAGEEIE